MREMRLAKREITDPEVLKEIVEECDTVRLGLTDAEGMFIVPVNYGYEFTEENGKAELQLYFHGAAEGRKADALKSQSPVAVEMDCRHGIITGGAAESPCNCETTCPFPPRPHTCRVRPARFPARSRTTDAGRA